MMAWARNTMANITKNPRRSEAASPARKEEGGRRKEEGGRRKEDVRVTKREEEKERYRHHLHSSIINDIHLTM